MREQVRVPPGFRPIRFRQFLVAAILATGISAPLLAQQPSAQTPSSLPGAPTPAASASPVDRPPILPRQTHHFWDKENAWLFAGVGASRALDYSSTLNFRRRGDNEVFLTNAMVDNHPAFAAVEAGATGLSIGVSYLFHHYNHHKLERWTSIVHMSATTVGAVHNYCLKTVHTSGGNASTALLPPMPLP
jgi:hypothetical protein